MIRKRNKKDFFHIFVPLLGIYMDYGYEIMLTNHS